MLANSLRAVVAREAGEGLKAFFARGQAALGEAEVKGVRPGTGWLRVAKGGGDGAAFTPDVPREVLEQWNAAELCTEVPNSRRGKKEVSDEFRAEFLEAMKEKGYKAGKWLLRLRVEDIEEAIAKVDEAQESGALGSTMMEVFFEERTFDAAGEGKKGSLLFALYTQDFTDEAAREAVRERFIELMGKPEFVRYKLDAASQLEHLWENEHDTKVSLKAWVGTEHTKDVPQVEPTEEWKIEKRVVTEEDTVGLKEWGKKESKPVGLKEWGIKESTPRPAAAEEKQQPVFDLVYLSRPARSSFDRELKQAARAKASAA